MTPAAMYALDADVLIQAARNFYAFDIAPGFWGALIQHASDGRVLSIDRVKAEIERGNDQLKDWCCNDFHQWFHSTDRDDVLESYGELMNWAYGQAQLMDAAKSEFAQQDNADAWLVSYALVHNRIGTGAELVVVTQETFDPNIRSRIKIPNVCRAFGVRHIDMFQMLRALGVRLG